MTRLDRCVISAGLIGFAVAGAIGLAHVPWLWHPLGACPAHPINVRTACRSYNFWSGISGSNITLPFAAVAYALGWWHQHNCHQRGCPRLQWHPHPEHGHPVCRKHHPHSDSEHPAWTTSDSSSPTSEARSS